MLDCHIKSNSKRRNMLRVERGKINSKPGIPYTQFDVEDVEQEYGRLVRLGVKFRMKPTEMGTVKIAIFEDTCGNTIQIIEMS